MLPTWCVFLTPPPNISSPSSELPPTLPPTPSCSSELLLTPPSFYWFLLTPPTWRLLDLSLTKWIYIFHDISLLLFITYFICLVTGNIIDNCIYYNSNCIIVYTWHVIEHYSWRIISTTFKIEMHFLFNSN